MKIYYITYQDAHGNPVMFIRTNKPEVSRVRMHIKSELKSWETLRVDNIIAGRRGETPPRPYMMAPSKIVEVGPFTPSKVGLVEAFIAGTKCTK